MRHPPVLVVLVAVACLLTACDSDPYGLKCDDYEPVDVTVHFSGFGGHVGQKLFLRVTGSTHWNPPDPGPYEEICRTGTVIPAGDFSIHEPAGALTCLSLHVDLFVDVNDNGVYDAPPTDHAWRLYSFRFENQGGIEASFSYTLSTNSCLYYDGETQSYCKYLDIEWPDGAPP